MKQPEQGGSYIYDPETGVLTKVESAPDDQAPAATPEEAKPATQPASGTARKR